MTVYCDCDYCKFNEGGICNNFNDRIWINDVAECDSYIEKDDEKDEREM